MLGVASDRVDEQVRRAAGDERFELLAHLLGRAVNVGFARASSNHESINLLPAVGANVYDIMRHDTLVLTRAAVEKLEARFNG